MHSQRTLSSKTFTNQEDVSNTWLSRDMKLIQETRDHLEEQLKRKQTLTEQLERVGSVLAAARTGIDSIASKLKDARQPVEVMLKVLFTKSC